MNSNFAVTYGYFATLRRDTSAHNRQQHGFFSGKKSERNTDPVTYFDDADFIRRYRLPKAMVEDLARQYEVSGVCSTMCSSSRAGITASQRVSSI